MVFIIDAGCFAVFRTHRAVLALISIETDFQKGETGEERQDSTHRTDGVAVSASPSPCQHKEHHKGDGGNDEYRQRLHPHIDGVEGIAVGALCKYSQHIITELPDWLENHGGDTAVGTVRRQQLEEGANAGHCGDDEDHQHGIAQPAHFLGIAVLILLPMETGKDILKDT